MITNAPWYVPNTVIRKDLQIPKGEFVICCAVKLTYALWAAIPAYGPNKLLHIHGTSNSETKE
jgi:hypothetical protein